MTRKYISPNQLDLQSIEGRRINARQMRTRMRARKTAMVKLLGGKCFDCQNKFPNICFHFDHRDIDAKKFNIALNLLRPLKILEAEVLQCDLVCANCHAVRTKNNFRKLSKKMSAGWERWRRKRLKRSLKHH